MRERHPFTDAEDDYLAEYIAKNNPEQAGRNGNNLYKTLVENPKRWPWSKSHPWQSWRERYKMNAEWFDRKIKRYLRQQREAREAASVAGPSTKVLNEAEPSTASGTAKRKGPPKATAITERKQTAPRNQQTSTSVNGGKPTNDNAKISKDTGNSSTDSGYASTNKKITDEQEQKDAAKRPSHQTATTVPSSSTKRSHPVSLPNQEEEDDVSETEGSSEGEEEEEDTPQEPAGEDDYMNELFGSSEDEEDDPVEPEDPPASSVPSSPTTERMYPDPRDIPPPDTTEKELYVEGPLEIARTVPSEDPALLTTETSRLPSSPAPAPPARRPAGTLQRLLKRKIADDDPFIDSTPPPPSPTERIAMRKAPPVLNEGPFGNRYVRTRNPGENLGENQSVTPWPPNRKRKENEEPSQTIESPAPTLKAVVGRKTQQQVNAVASSSKVKLPASTALRSDDPVIETARQSDHLPKDALLSKHALLQPPSKRQKCVHPPTTYDTAHNAFAPTIPKPNPVGFKSKGMERPVTRINLRESLIKRRSRSAKNSIVSSRASTASISTSLSTHVNRRDSAASSTSHRQRVSNNEDVELMSLFERDLVELGEQYGFSLGVVKQTYLQFGTLDKTVTILRALNAMMKGAQDKLFENFFNENDEDRDTDGDLIPEGVIPKLASSRGEGKGKEKEEEGRSHGTPSKQRRSLNYKPLTTDVEDQSEYLPPSRSRAGRYTKLQKEGREEEALVAASGRRDALHTRMDSREERMEVSSPLDLDRMRSRMLEDNSVATQETEFEAQGHDEEEDDDDIERDRMDVSSDQFGVREPTPDDKQVGEVDPIWRAQHKKLCSEATLRNQDSLRAFEEGQVGNLLRGISGDWIKERISRLKDIQEVRRRTKVEEAEEGEQ